MSDEQNDQQQVNVDPTLAGATVITDDMLAAAEEATKAADAENRGESPDEDEKPTDADDKAADDKAADDKSADDDGDEKKGDPEDLELSEDDGDEGDEGGEGELIDISAYAEEFASEDGPSEETMKLLTDALGEKFANAPDLINIFRAGQAAIAQQQSANAFEITGGGENYAAMQAWAKDNLSKEERADFNEAIKGSGRNLAIRGLYAQFTEATGHDSGDSADTETDTSHITSGTAVTGGVAPLVSIQEISKLTADPRFDTDPAFRKDVERRIAAGNKQRS